MALDSVDTHYDPKVDFNTGQSPSILLSTEHILQPVNDKAVDKSIVTSDWLLGVLLLIFAILAWVRVYHIKQLGELFQAFLYRLYLSKILRSSDSLITRISLALNAIFILTTSVFVLQLLEFQQLKLPFSEAINPFFIILAVVGLVYPVKALVVRIIGWVFNDSDIMTEYTFNIFLLNKILGLGLLPIIVLQAYLSFGQLVLMYIGVFLIAISYMYRIYRGYFIGRASANLSQVYIFLYLCTLEILPLAVAARFISSEL